MDLWKLYLRWRHSKGFGVHSPYAYRFVTDVLRPGPYRYYSYWEIEERLRGKERDDTDLMKLIRFTIRLAIFLKAKRIIFHQGSARFAEVAAQCLRIPFIPLKKSESFVFGKGDLLIMEGETENPESLKKAIAAGTAVFAVNPRREIRAIIDNPIERGLLLRGKHRMILIPRQEMAYVAYDINLKGGDRRGFGDL